MTARLPSCRIPCHPTRAIKHDSRRRRARRRPVERGGETAAVARIAAADGRSGPGRPIRPRPTHLVPQAFVLPSARKVVSSGLQLALTSSAASSAGPRSTSACCPRRVRAGDIMILLIGRATASDRAADALANVSSPCFIARHSRRSMGPLVVVYLLMVLVGILLLVAISVDAQVIAISILGGPRRDRPMRPARVDHPRATDLLADGRSGPLVGVVASSSSWSSRALPAPFRQSARRPASWPRFSRRS